MKNVPLHIVLVGAGNVATHLAQALAREHRVVQIYSRTAAAAETLAQAIGCSATHQLETLVEDADVYVVSVKDDALPSILPRLKEVNPRALFVHTAGSIPMEIWKPYVQHYGVLYPMQTFSKTKPIDMTQVPFFIEATAPEDRERLYGIARSMSEKVYDATSEQRKMLHIAAVFCCNFTNHLYAMAADLLEKHGLPFEAMYPLIDETTAKIKQLTPYEGQTGPAVRNDISVMQLHTDLLSAYPELQTIYKQLSESIVLHHSPKT